jgi:hypothetical protein
MLDLDSAINNPNNIIFLTSQISPNSVSVNKGNFWGVKGFVTQDINISGGVDWGTPGTSFLLDQAADYYNKLLSGAAIFGFERPQLAFKSIKQSQLLYTGTQQFELNIPMMFISITESDVENDSVRRSVAEIERAKYPSIPTLTDLSAKLEAPLGYTAGKVDSQEGVYGAISVKIGKWFEIRKRLMVVNNSDFSFSKEVDRKGQPLFAVGSVSLVASRVVSEEEMRKFITTPTDQVGVRQKDLVERVKF